MASLLCVVSWALLGCGNDSDETVILGGVVNLAGADGAALAGLTFAFPDATIFGFPGGQRPWRWAMRPPPSPDNR